MKGWRDNCKKRSMRGSLGLIFSKKRKMCRMIKYGSTFKVKLVTVPGRKESQQPVSSTLHLRKRKASQLSKSVGLYQLRPLTQPGISYDESKHLQNQKESGDLLSNAGCEDVVEECEASWKRYATMAMEKYENLFSNCELVQAGPLEFGRISTGLLLHLNFKVKNKDEPGAVLQTYFSELTKTHRNVVSVDCLRLLGPSNSLPVKAESIGCIYCCSHTVHHPDGPLGGFRTGREDHWTNLCSQIDKMRDFIRQSEDRGFSPSFSHPGVYYFGKSFTDTKLLLATVALNLFKGEKGANFELADCEQLENSGLGKYFGSVITRIGRIFHINFEAKNKDDPNASVQTFFAEVIRNRTFLFAAFCECLGPSDSLPEEDHHDCQYCRPQIHHPPGPGYLTGRKNLPRSS